MKTIRREPVADDYAIRTKEEVGALLGVSRTRVYQVERQFIAKLRAEILRDRVLRQAVIDLGLSPREEAA